MLVVKPNQLGIKKAIAALKKGGVIVYPTDTAYALGGIFNSPKVIKIVLKIKKRADPKFTLVAANLKQVEKIFKLNILEKKLAKKYWPGPLSIVVSSRFSVRVPKNKIARLLALKTGKPLIATSANLSGAKTPYDSQKIIKAFKSKKTPASSAKKADSARQEPDLILDFGRLPKKPVSTIIRVKNKKIEIIRQGGIKI